MTIYKSITDSICSMVRSGEITFISARVECNPETGSKRPFEVIKTTACGKDFRAASFASDVKANASAAQSNNHYEAKRRG